MAIHLAIKASARVTLRTLFGVAAAWTCTSPAVAILPTERAPSLTYRVHGEISANCSLSQAARAVEIVDLADPSTNLARAATANLAFEIACNTLVRVAMRSRNGGLKAAGATTGDRDFDGLVGYRARLDLPRRSAALECDSATMGALEAGCRDDIAQPILAGRGAVAVRVVPGGGLLLAGRYSDQLTVSITPILGSGER